MSIVPFRRLSEKEQIKHTLRSLRLCGEKHETYWRDINRKLRPVAGGPFTGIKDPGRERRAYRRDIAAAKGHIRARPVKGPWRTVLYEIHFHYPRR